ncbi:MAG: cobalamin-dependent protein, partial [Ignavibacteriaceae bacterium]|nr:cobalamin-dependent protein [Ignavibacteriaceae bacterium]
MNIAFINPPFLPKYSRGSRSPAVTKSGTVYYPIWLALAAGYSERFGHKIILIDAPAEPITKEETIKRLADFNPDLAVIETSTGSISNDVRFAAGLKEIFPAIFICLVGNHVTACDKDTLAGNNMINSVARNEYEETIVDLANRLEKKESLESVLSLTWRKGNNIFRNESRLPLQNLDEMPFASEIFKRFVDPGNYFFSAGRFPQ